MSKQVFSHFIKGYQRSEANKTFIIPDQAHSLILTDICTSDGGVLIFK